MIASITRHEAATNRQSMGDYQLSPNVVVLNLEDGTARLLDLGGNFYALSLTGAAMLSATLREGSARAAQSISSAYNVDIATIQHDLRAFLADLEARQLIIRSEQPLPFSWKTRLALRLLPPLLHCIHARFISLKVRGWELLMLSYLSTHLFGWPSTVLAWQHSLRSTRAFSTSADEIEKTVQAVISTYPWSVACKERALCCWYLLRSTGRPARLIVGIALCPLASHCWCELDSVPFCDESSYCQQFTPVLCYE